MLTAEDYSISKCFMPNENTVYMVYAAVISIAVLYIFAQLGIACMKRRHNSVDRLGIKQR